MRRERREVQEALEFRDEASGFEGWRVQLEPHGEIPTPALAGDTVVVGGGFGSYDLFALDARSGRLRWRRTTSDDGPTAAVITGRHVAYNTESCTVEVLDLATGRPLWSHWLGDPLLAQPAMDSERLFAVFPADGAHWLGAFALADGRALWRARLQCDAITAPVLADSHVYLATLDGWVWSLERSSGKVDWSRDLGATSAPWIDGTEVYVSHREPQEQPARPHSRRHSARPREQTSRFEQRTGRRNQSYEAKLADYLAAGWGSERKRAFLHHDQSVGFGSAPSAAKLEYASLNIGESLVSRVWRYQGSRAVVVDGVLYDSTGDRLEARDPLSGGLRWSWTASAPEGERALTAPAVVPGRVYVGTFDGRVVSLDARTGAVRFEVRVGAPVHWQPSVSAGRVFAGLSDGHLVAFATGDPSDDGWPMWGGGAGHNGATSAAG